MSDLRKQLSGTGHTEDCPLAPEGDDAAVSMAKLTQDVVPY
jgi:hypothetical protein